MRPAACSSRAFQITVPEPMRSPFHQPLSIGPPDSTIAGRLTVAAAMMAGRRGLVAAGGQHDAVERIAEQHLDEAEIGEIAVERRGRPLAGLLDRVHRKFERDAAGVADAVAHALGEFDVMAVAGREIGAGLGDADDRLAGRQLVPGQAVIEIALQIERRHAGIVRIVEPQLRAQAGLCHVARPFDLFLPGMRGRSANEVSREGAPRHESPLHRATRVPLPRLREGGLVSRDACPLPRFTHATS